MLLRAKYSLSHSFFLTDCENELGFGNFWIQRWSLVTELLWSPFSSNLPSRSFFQEKRICLPILSSFLSIIRGANRLLATAAWYLEDQTALIQMRSWPHASKDASVPLSKLSRESTTNVTEDQRDSLLKCLSCFGRQNSSVPRRFNHITSPRQGKQWTRPRVCTGTPSRSERR